MVVMDVVIFMLVWYLASVIRFGYEDGIVFFIERLPTEGFSTLIFVAVLFAAGMYEPQTLSDKKRCFITALICMAIAMVVIILVFYTILNPLLGRGLVSLALLLGFFGIWGVRALYRLAVGTGFFAKPALLVGCGSNVEAVVELINSTGTDRYKIYGIVSDGESFEKGFVKGIPVIGHVDQLKEYVGAYDIEAVILATTLHQEYQLLRRLRPLRYAGVELLDFVSLHEQLAMFIPLDHIDDEWLLHAAMNSSRMHIRKIKRIFDVLVAALGLLLSFPICMLTAVLIKLTSQGPIFYRQQRSGLNGEVFTVIKFRTMRANAEASSGAVWADKFDSRITSVGRVLRATRIDEIPQLVNVLRGNMSLVGPRPERPEFQDTLIDSIPFYEERLLVPPGITGWAQVMYPYAASVEAARRKLQYDLFYIKHTSLVMDIAILLKTFKTILVGLRHSEDHAGFSKPSKNASNLTILPDRASAEEIKSAKAKGDSGDSAHSA